MKCFTCKTAMECYDDVVTEIVRLDFVKCPKCNSKATIKYGNSGEYISRVKWDR